MDRIGPYRIVAGPFQGGFGEVFKVFDGDSGDEFALKTLKDAFLSTSRRLERFRREIALWMRIPVHPNVVRAVRAFDHADRPYVLVEWIAGGNLAERMTELGPRDRGLRAIAGAVDALEVLRQACAGMAHIHAHGLVHGDLKPSNIMMWAGKSPQITDFGFARMADEDERGLVGGTARYLAPELAGGDAPTRASDIYAAGIVFLDVLASSADTESGVAEGRAMAHAMCSERPEDRPASFADVQEKLRALVARAPLAPAIPARTGDRRTWDELHVAPAVPERDRLNRATSDLAAGRRAEAEAQLESIIADEPGMFDARIALASLLVQDGRREAAIAHAEAARHARGGESPHRRLTLASLLAELEMDEDAGQVLAGLEAEQDLRGEVWHLRARIAERRGDLSDAIELFRRALDEGGGAHVRFSLAGVLREAGLIEAAIAEYESVGKTDRALGLKVALLLARLYVDIERFDDALRALREALKLDLGRETEAYVYAEMGYAYRCQGLPEAALASYRKSLALAPGSQAVLDGIELVERMAAGDR